MGLKEPPLVSVSPSRPVVASREGVGVVAVFPLCTFIALAEVDLDHGNGAADVLVANAVA
jgi:hypothetical protein